MRVCGICTWMNRTKLGSESLCTRVCGHVAAIHCFSNMYAHIFQQIYGFVLLSCALWQEMPCSVLSRMNAYAIWCMRAFVTSERLHTYTLLYSTTCRPQHENYAIHITYCLIASIHKYTDLSCLFRMHAAERPLQKKNSHIGSDISACLKVLYIHKFVMNERIPRYTHTQNHTHAVTCNLQRMFALAVK